MRSYLDNLRRKPKAVRAQISLAVAGSFTAVFFLIWSIGLAERMGVDSADPTIAKYQQEIEEKEIVAKSEVRPFSLFGQVKRGIAAVISNQEDLVEEEKSLDDKVIDINAMIQNPQPRKLPPTPEATTPTTTTENVSQIVVPVGEGDSSVVGSVILIGTTTNSNNPENSD